MKFDQLEFTLGGGSNTVSLSGAATGGNGNFGGLGGHGGSSGGDISSVRTDQSGASTVLTIAEAVGSVGGLGRIGANGGAGREGKVTFSDLSFAGARLNIDLSADAQGGNGGGAVGGGIGGSGNVGAAGGNGGKGGAAGAGLAEVAGLTVAATVRLSLAINLEATGGTGGGGGRGGASGFGQTFVSDIAVSSIGGESGTIAQTVTSAAAGNGGAGGIGGAATARINGATVTGTALGDTVDIRLTATAGAGGPGGTGGPAVDSYTSVTPGDVQSTYTQIGTATGSTGRTGAPGTATVEMTGVSIALGGGADTLRLSLMTEGAGRKAVVFANNNLDGGAGVDRLELGTGRPGELGATVNVNTGTLAIGNSGNTSILRGFEVFVGGAGADRFVDGAGDHTYSGGAGADTFVFRKGAAGADRVTDFATGDKLLFLGFGAAINSFADVQAISLQSASGVLIQLAPQASVLIENRTLASLTVDDFLFA